MRLTAWRLPIAPAPLEEATRVAAGPRLAACDVPTIRAWAVASTAAGCAGRGVRWPGMRARGMLMPVTVDDIR